MRVFDADFYLAINEDVALAGVDPLDHYRQLGWKEDRDPSPLFDVSWYLDQAPHLRTGGVEPLQHYIDFGWLEGLDPVPEFDTDWYLASYPDAARTGGNPLLHYLEVGRYEGRDTSDAFSTSNYLSENPDALEDDTDALTHFRTRLAIRNSHAGSHSADVNPIASVTSRMRPRPLPVIRGEAEPSVILVTENLSFTPSLIGIHPVCLLAALLAVSLGRRLRVVTTQESADPATLREALAWNGIELPIDSRFEFLPTDGSRGPILSHESDLFVTSTWQLTHSALASLKPTRIVSFIDTDPRVNAVSADQALIAAATLNAEGTRAVVLGEGLRNHLISTGLPHLASAATTLPLPLAIDGGLPKAGAADPSRNVIVTARPRHPSSLFGLSLEAIATAFRDGCLDGETTFHFFGPEIPNMTLPDGSRPIIHRRIDPREYRRLVDASRAALCLTSAGDTIYPAWELAASGIQTIVTTPAFMPPGGLQSQVHVVDPTPRVLARSLGDALRADQCPQSGAPERVQSEFVTALTAVLPQLVS